MPKAVNNVYHDEPGVPGAVSQTTSELCGFPQYVRNVDTKFPGNDNSRVNMDHNCNGENKCKRHAGEECDKSDMEVEKDWKYFWKRVFDDMKNKDLIPVKVLFFFKFATLFVLYPFLTLHMKSLGLNEFEIGVNQATIPIVAIFGPPFAGIVADRIGNFKVILAVMTIANALLALALLQVPPARSGTVYEPYSTFEFHCLRSIDEDAQFGLTLLDPHECTLTNDTDRITLPSTFVQCGRICRMEKFDDSVTARKKLEIPTTLESLLPDHQSVFQPLPRTRPVVLCNNVDNNDINNCNLELKYYDDNEQTVWTWVTNETQRKTEERNALQFQAVIAEFQNFRFLGHNHNLNFTNSNSSVPLHFALDGNFTWDGFEYYEPQCLNDRTSPYENETGCPEKCLLQLPRDKFCSNNPIVEHDVPLTFGVYTLIRILLGFSSATTFIMFEGAVLAIIKEFGGDYGLQRISATVAAIIAAPIAGVLIKLYSFPPAVYLYSCLQILCAALTLMIDLEFKTPAKNVFAHLKEVLVQIEILIFFFAMLCSGTAWGYLETFLFLYLKDLGGSEILMGLTISVGGFAGLPLLIFSRPIIKRLGHVNILCLGLLFYCVRLFGYSFIQDPWTCLFFEAMEGITVSLAITAAATYAVALSTLQTITSVQGIFGGLYFGIGRGAGSLIGGVLINAYGHRLTYQIFGIGCIIASLLYFIVNILYLRKHSKAHLGPDAFNLNATKKRTSPEKIPKQSSGTLNPAFTPAPELNEEQFAKTESEDTESPFENLDLNKFTDVPLDEDSFDQSRPGAAYTINTAIVFLNPTEKVC